MIGMILLGGLVLVLAAFPLLVMAVLLLQRAQN